MPHGPVAVVGHGVVTGDSPFTRFLLHFAIIAGGTHMRITDGTEICQVCGKVPSIIYCDGCEKPLCRACRKFDMWQQGCGSIPTKVFCVACATNPWVNPWGSMMD